jgi:hypothetical protein
LLPDRGVDQWSRSITSIAPQKTYSLGLSRKPFGS